MTIDIYTFLQQMPSFAEKKDWQGLEKHFGNICQKMHGKKQFEQASKIELSNYQSELLLALQKAMTLVTPDIRAIYFEYNLDNNWASSFYLCSEYRPLSEEDDDWACYTEGMVTLEGPSNEAFSRIYEDALFEHGWDNPTTLYLIAKTVSSFGRVIDQVETQNLKVCMAFHDQDPVLRMS